MRTDEEKNYQYQIAMKRVRKIKGFYGHLLAYLFVNIAIFVVISRNEGFLEAAQSLENYFTAFFWGIGLLGHWIGVFGSNFIFSRQWEEKKIREIMEGEKQKTWE